MLVRNVTEYLVVEAVEKAGDELGIYAYLAGD